MGFGKEKYMKRFKTEKISITPERKKCSEFFRIKQKYNTSKASFKRILKDYWVNCFPKEKFPSRNVEMAYILLGYHLQVEALYSEESDIPLKVWKRYEASKKLNLQGFDDGLRAVITLNNQGDPSMSPTVKKIKEASAKTKAKAPAKTKAKTSAKTKAKAPVKTKTVEQKTKATPKLTPGVSRRGGVGVNRGLTRTETYRVLFEENFAEGMTDDELASALCAEFPQLKDYTAADIRVHRAIYNKGQLGSQTGPPKDKSTEYDEEGRQVKRHGRKVVVISEIPSTQRAGARVAKNVTKKRKKAK